MMATAKQRLRTRVLRQRGLASAPKGHLAPVTPAPVARDHTGRKSLAMLLMEEKHGKPLEELLAHGKLAELSLTLGVSEATISRWRKRLGLGQWSL